jgi:hypothetical protein
VRARHFSDALFKKKWQVSRREFTVACEADVFEKFRDEAGIVQIDPALEKLPGGCPKAIACFKLPANDAGEYLWEKLDTVFAREDSFPFHRCNLQPSADFVVVGEVRFYHCVQFAPVRVPSSLDSDGDATFIQMFRKEQPKLWVVMTACKVSGAHRALLAANGYKWRKDGF